MKQKFWVLWFAGVIVAIIYFTLQGCGGSSYVSPTPESSVSISASPTVVSKGEPTTLTWTSTGADYVSISGVPDASSPSGVIVVTPEKTTTYTATAYLNSQPAASSEITVTVLEVTVPPPPPPPPPQVYSVMIEAIWELPSTYTDGTPISPDNQALITVEVYMGTSPPFDNTMLPLATSPPGATSVTFGPVDVVQGTTYYFAAKSISDGRKSEFSPVAAHIWE